MGRRGPPPTPTAILKLRNSTLVRGREGEPEPPREVPSCPAWLDKDAKSLWRRLVVVLDGMRVLTKADRFALARYCREWTRWRRAQVVIETDGETYDTTDGNGNLIHRVRPEVGIIAKLDKALTACEDRFGLTPAARSRLRIEGEKDAKPKDPKADLKARLFGAG